MAKGPTHILMVTSKLVDTDTGKNLAKELTLFLMEEDMRVNGKIIKIMGRGHSHGLMEIFMLVNGRMGIFTVMAR